MHGLGASTWMAGSYHLSNYSQTPLIRPSLIRLNGSPPGNGWEQIFLHRKPC